MSFEFTISQAQAVADVLNERLAGGISDFADAFGIDEDGDEAEKMFADVEDALHCILRTLHHGPP